MKVQPNPNITPHFKLREFDCADGSIVPAKYHANLIRLCTLLEDIREMFGGRPVTVVSGYRSQSHNDKLYAAQRRKDPKKGKLSQHLTASAADIIVEGMNIFEVQRRLEDLFDIGTYKGSLPTEKYSKVMTGLRGLGLGAHRGFVHVDVREGRRAKWTY